MKRCVDTACLDRYEGATLLSLESFALVGGAQRGGRIVTDPASVASGNSRCLEGCCWFQCSSERLSPFLWRNGWVSRELLVTTFRFITIESTD